MPVTGIGGVFIKSKGDHKALAAWYQEHLGLRLEDYGVAVLKWPDDKAEDKGATAWGTAPSNSDWFETSFMINYRVQDLDGMVAHFKTAGVEIVKGPESHENGKFVWVRDPEGNKVELWEPMNWDPKNKEL